MRPLATLSILLALLAVTTAAPAQQPGRAAPPAADTGRAGGEFARLVRDATVHRGLFDMYEKADRLYLAVPRNRLGEEFLLSFQIGQGIGANGLFGGTMLSLFESRLVVLERRGDRIYLVQRPHRYTASDAATREAVDLSYGSSVLESARIEATRDDSAAVINVHDWFVSDLSDIGARVRAAVAPRPGVPGRATLDRNRSYLESVRAFPRNVNVRAKLTFSPGEPVNLRTVPDSRWVPVGVHYSLAALPEQPMRPRMGDDRMGYFMTVHKNFSRDDRTFFARYVNRWRLECGRQVGELCEPVRPITYYIDRTVPVDMRPWLIAGVEAWNTAFERAGFRNAIRAEMLPDSADAGDIRYATLRWNTSDQPGYGAIGPSTVDPRTGEILDADILFEAGMIQGFRNTWRTQVDPAGFVAAVLGPSTDEQESLAAGGETASFGALFAAQGALLRTVLAARGEIGPGDPVPMSYVGEALKWVTMHEVGHTLGLRHNFRSSSDTPLDSLHSRTFAERNGLYSSAMEYPVPNIAPPGRTNGYYYSPGVGSSDGWVIAYGYTPDDASAARIARQGAQPGHAYGTDEDAGGPASVDPTITPNDMSSDPLGWARQRTALLADMWRRLPGAVLTDNSPYSDLTQAYQTLLGQYAGALAVSVKYIGGQRQYRDHAGDPGGRPPFVNIPREQQRAALEFLTRQAFAENAFALPPEVVRQFGADRWSHWGATPTVNGRIDYPFHTQVLGVQAALLGNALHPVRLARIRDAELRHGPEAILSIGDLMSELTRAIWSEVWAAPSRNVNAVRRDLQREYLDRMVDLMVRPPAGTPHDARAATRVRLTDLERRLAARLATPARLDAATIAHFTETRARITRALAAGLEVERP